MELALLGMGTSASLNVLLAVAAAAFGAVLIVASTSDRLVASSQRAVAATGCAFLATGLIGLLYLT